MCLTMWWMVLTLGVVGAAQSSCTGMEDMCSSTVDKLVVTFGSLQPACNARVTVQDAAVKPRINLPSAAQGSRYVLLMVDPDATCWLHFAAVVKKSGSNLVYEKELIGYMGPSPPVGQGAHRYQFLLWAWPGPDVSSMSVNTNMRRGFELNDFKTKNHFGNPTAVFQFKTENY
ncbi:protein D2-like [Gigantopelta aegis]|uniref:protein D2-like n=1 Tax=Gigantopelta aegis TaxID=1735272 RepID=UPI001B88D5B1|nr:protein D2-like [Gigantopelta aegis]